MIAKLFLQSHRNNIGDHLKALRDFLDSHSSTYEKVLILGNFNVKVDEQNMKTFCDSCSLTRLIKQPTCYKNPSHLTCIDLILTNVLRSFHITHVIETELSDFHLVTLTVMRKSLKKLKPTVINYLNRHLSITIMGLKSFAILVLLQ